MTESAVAATHTLVWYLSNASRLSTRALRMLDQAVQRGGPIYIASITLVELAYLVERGRLATSNLLAIGALLNGGHSALSLVALDQGVARALRCIPRDIVPDMPDRIIAATGLYLNAPVVTRAPHIQAAPIATIW